MAVPSQAAGDSNSQVFNRVDRLIDADTCGFVRLLEITRSELFDELMESPDDVIQLEMRSTSCWRMVESQPLVRGLYSSISFAQRMTEDPGENWRSAKELI